MTSVDTAIKKCTDAFVPPMPESYTGMISDTLAQLKAKNVQRSKPIRKRWKSLAAAAVLISAVMAVPVAVFSARPALAAGIPGVSGIVYAAAPIRNANDDDRERIEALLRTAFSSLAECDYDAASRNFRQGAMRERGNYLAAAYLNHLATFDESFFESANAGEIEIADLQAEQKAFRFTAHVSFCPVSKNGQRTALEECTAYIWENAEGMHIERIEIHSESFCSYVRMYEAAFGTVSPDGLSFGIIPIDNSYLNYVHYFSGREGARQRESRLSNMLAELDAVSAAVDEKAARIRLIKKEIENTRTEITPEVISVEKAAAELMYRYWIGRKTGEVRDFSDILMRNEQTDLFFWDAVLEAEKVELGVVKPLTSVKVGCAQIEQLLENADGMIKARFYVQTEITDGIMKGVGEEIILTLRKDEHGYTIIGFDREVGDGLYTYRLKPLAAEYMNAGYSWQEAGQMAYDVLHAQIVRDAEWFAGY